MEKDRVKIAAAQMDPQLMKNGQNLAKMVDMTRKATAGGADLGSFPRMRPARLCVQQS